MVAIFIASICMSVTLTYFMSNRQAYDLTNAIADNQSAARIAHHILSFEAHQAGYFGCLHNSNLKNITDLMLDTPFVTKKNSEEAVKYLTQNIRNRIRPGDDILWISYLKPPLAPVTKISNNHQHIDLDHPIKFKLGEKWLISDCQKAEIIAPTSANNSSDQIDLSHALLHKNYHAPSEELLAGVDGMQVIQSKPALNFVLSISNLSSNKLMQTEAMHFKKKC